MTPPINIYRKVELKEPVLIVGWPGMGQVALGAVNYLKDKFKAEALGDISPVGFFEAGGVIVQDGVAKAPALPESKFHFWTGPKSDVVILAGEAQPTHGAPEYARQVVEAARQLGAKRVISTAAAPASINHHDRPKVWAVANQPSLLDYLKQHDVVLMQNGHISGMNGLVLAAAAEQGVEAFCLLGEIPYYAVGLPNPRASQAILQVISHMLDLKLDLRDLEMIAKEAESEIDHMVKTSQQMADLVQRLEPGKAPEVSSVPDSVEQQLKDRSRIEALFRQAEKDRSRIAELKTEMDRLGVFADYQDRFLNLFRKDNQ